jgi:hypothetical protein
MVLAGLDGPAPSLLIEIAGTSPAMTNQRAVIL